MVVTRFAPSPTGFLHIGGARTALFNYLFAKHHGGKYLLRIEDTDLKRSTEEAKQAILDGLSWLNIMPDADVVYQTARLERHKQVVQALLDKGMAYHCYASKEELDALRAQAALEKRSFIYPHIWRDKDPKDAPKDVEPVVRIKTALEGKTVIEDKVQGRVEVANDTIDDFVIARSDGTPTYMLAVVVDDVDMGVTHIIRGDDHLTNAFRQQAIYEAMEWQKPVYAHIPLIHGSDGAKMSKRHGALGVDAYEQMGFLPEAICNYLLRLGWSHGDDEIISREQAIEWFDLEHIGKSPARFDMEKLHAVNAHYIKTSDNADLVASILTRAALTTDSQEASILAQAMDGLKVRAKTMLELYDQAVFYIVRPTSFTDQAKKALEGEGKQLLQRISKTLEQLDANDWQHDRLEQTLKDFATTQGFKLGQLMAPVRAAITGSHASPSMFEAMAILGKEETLARLTIVFKCEKSL